MTYLLTVSSSMKILLIVLIVESICLQASLQVNSTQIVSSSTREAIAEPDALHRSNVPSRKSMFQPHNSPVIKRNRIFTQSQGNGFQTAILKEWSLPDYRISFVDDLMKANFGALYTNDRITNYSHFLLLPKLSVIFVIGNDVTILKLDMTKFFPLGSYTLPPPKNNIAECHYPWGCKHLKEISLVAMMPNEQMVWYCYVHQIQTAQRPPQHVDSGCIVPTAGNLADALIQWENPHFSSLDPRHPATVLNADDGFTYISAHASDYVRILRTQMPDWNGKFNWTGALVSDRSQLFIAEPAEILITFETENEVYFVLREQATEFTSSCNKDDRPGASRFPSSSRGGSESSVARLIRICKGDRGGLSSVNPDKFGTAAKAELHCKAADETGIGFQYTQISAAFWDKSTQRLFAIFRTEKWAPVGSALCIFTKQSIEAAFSGPLLKPNTATSCHWSTRVENPFKDICQRFNSKNLTSEELALGKRTSLSFLYRFNPIMPLYERAIVLETGYIWSHIQAYELEPLKLPHHVRKPARTTIVWFGTNKILTKLAMYEVSDESSPTKVVVCKLNELRLGSNLQGLKRKRRKVIKYTSKKDPPSDYSDYLTFQSATSSKTSFSEYWSDEEFRQIEIYASRIYILTNRQLLWLPLADCSIYRTFDECSHSKDPHCGWNWLDGRCTSGHTLQSQFSPFSLNMFSPSVNLDRVDQSQCPSDLPPGIDESANAWSAWHNCRWALGEDAPNGTRKVQRTQGLCLCRVCLSSGTCELGAQEVTNCTNFDKHWLEWTAWSRCDLSSGVQTRERACKPGAVCAGSVKEQRGCIRRSSAWSGWVQASDVEHSIADQPSLEDSRSRELAKVQLDERFTLAHLLSVGACSMFIGCVVTSVLFFLCRFCPGTQNSNKRRNQDVPTQHESRANLLTSKSKQMDESWLTKSLDGQPAHESGDDQSLRYGIIAGVSDSRGTRKPIFYSTHGGEERSDSTSLTATGYTPLPSPLSAISYPAAACNIVKDKFTFENIPSQSTDNMPSSEQMNPVSTTMQKFHPTPNTSIVPHAQSMDSSTNPLLNENMDQVALAPSAVNPKSQGQ